MGNGLLAASMPVLRKPTDWLRTRYCFGNTESLKVLRKILVHDVQYVELPQPLPARVKPEVVKNLPTVPASGMISIVGYSKRDNLVLFSHLNSTEQVDRIYIGHLMNSKEVREEIKEMT